MIEMIITVALNHSHKGKSHNHTGSLKGKLQVKIIVGIETQMMIKKVSLEVWVDPETSHKW